MTALSEGHKTDIEVHGHNGAPVAMRTLFNDKTPEREVLLVAAPDGMSAYMRLIPGPDYVRTSSDAILSIMTAAGIAHGFIGPGITLFVSTQNSPSPFTGFCQVARGDPMRKGENGSIEFHVQPTSLEARYDENDSGAIDYRQLNLIENCFSGQRVATILPPGPGRPGKNIFGEEIPAVPGEAVAVQAGAGIVMSATGRDFTSEVEGRLVFEDGILSVSPLLEIARDIDYSVGNVDFVGKVVVRGSLLDGFYINAKRGVEISGEVGAALITSEGDVKISGGIRGKNAAIITCRNLQAHYIDDASVEASGNVTATKEIMNSSVKSLGRVTVTQGAIIGGEVCGFHGVEADTLGSDMGVTTWVMAGLNWTEENRKEEIRARMAEFLDRVQSSQVLLEPLFNDKVATARLGSEQKSMLSELISELRDIRENLQELLEERSLIDNHEQVGMVNQINVRKMLYMGVSARFSQVFGDVKDSVKGPVSILPDMAANGLRVGASSPLPEIKKNAPAAAAGAVDAPLRAAETDAVGGQSPEVAAAADTPAPAGEEE